MIYAQNTTDVQLLFIPRKGTGPNGLLTLTAKNTIEKTEAINIPVFNQDISRLYYAVNIALPEALPNGEYEYELSDDAGILANGILYLGDKANVPSEFYKLHTYEQYSND